MNEHNEQLTAEKESSEAAARRQKVVTMREKGIEPWPSFKKVDANTVTLHNLALRCGPTESSEEYATSGRIIAKREHGKTAFFVIQDSKGTLQAYFKQEILGAENFAQLLDLLDTGDIIWLKGTLFTTKTGEPTIKVHEWQLTSKCLNPLAEKHSGLTDTEQRYRQRYLDLICNRDSLEKFLLRSKIVQQIRTQLMDKDFVEVETPMLHPIPGGAAARPFVTHHNAYDFDLYLRIAPELYLKRLVIGGMERVFEINRSFRNEGISTRHNPEFTTLEFYMAHGDYNDGMDLIEEIFKGVTKLVNDNCQITFNNHLLDFSQKIPRLTVDEAICKFGQLNPSELQGNNIDAAITKYGAECTKNASYGEKLFALFEAVAESKIIQPTFLVGYPIEVSPLAKRDPNNPNTAARFELFVCGMELSNGFTELNDPFDQADRFRMQVQARADGNVEAHHYDADYVHALEYALPPTVGAAIGIDRLTMLLTNTQSIKDVILFPTLRPKKE